MSQSVVITGGQGSLARAIARHLADVQPDWVVHSPARSEMDVSSENSIKAYLQDRPCDLLIAAAGVISDQLLAKTHEDDWDAVMKSNLRGAALAAKWAGRSMLSRKAGHVIFIGSYSAYHPPMGQVAYASAKAGLIGLTKSLAREWGRANIRVNTILPGFLENRMTEEVSPLRKQQVLGQHALGRFNTEHEVAAFIHFLHTVLRHTSGQIFTLDSRILSD